MICPACWILFIIVIVSGATAFSPDYLSSLSKNNNNSIQQPTTRQTNDISNTDIQHEQHNDNMNTNEQDEIPDEHYSKDYPNAGWRGYANSQRGGYLDNLTSSSSNSQLEEGKKSDYGDDVRWGTEVYLSSIEKGNQK